MHVVRSTVIQLGAQQVGSGGVPLRTEIVYVLARSRVGAQGVEARVDFDVHQSAALLVVFLQRGKRLVHFSQGRHIRTRLYCHDRALWKLRWFLFDFGYDSDLLADEVLDDRRVLGLEGVIRLAYWGSDGQRRLDVQGFAPAARWEELSKPEAPAVVATAGAES